MAKPNKEISTDLNKSIEKSIKENAKEERENFLYGKKIAISVSESENIQELGFSKIHQQDIILEITRYLLINGATLIYGGDLRAQGYTFLFSELVDQYIYERGNKNYYKNYFSFPIYVDMPQKYRLDFKKNGVDIVNVIPPENLNLDITQSYPPVNNENLFIWAESLTKMRIEMCNDSDARIFMGGAKSNFKGKYPGLLEEAVISLENNIPTYLIGAFGGITRSIIDSVNGKYPKELTEDWQSELSSPYKDFLKFYNSKPEVVKIDYDKSLNFLTEFGMKGLCKNNGLDTEDNFRLFETIHLPEIIYLILKGLNNKFRSV